MRAKFFVAWLTAASRFAFAATPSDAPVSDLAAAIEHARERVFPTLVHIQPIFDVASGGRTIEASATGSGAIIREDGLVVTNFHVAGSAKRLICTLADRRKVSARLVGVDAPTDLALLRLELSELGLEKIACATFAERLPKEGEFVVAMGSPLGLTRSLSFGVVSCSQRYLGELRLNGGAATGLFNTWIQTDAAINPGNSGGPLVALDGAIVGVNSRGFDRADNLGFAIPASVVLEVIDRLLSSRRWRADRPRPRQAFARAIASLVSPDNRSMCVSMKTCRMRCASFRRRQWAPTWKSSWGACAKPRRSCCNRSNGGCKASRTRISSSSD
jgi:S1-C subfamily serine protease